jgi:hypothetical protein
MALTVQNSSPSLSGAGSVYWVGQDGNVYYKTSSGTSNLGAAQGTGTTANLVLNGAKEIADPNPGNPAMKNTALVTGGSGGAAAPVLNTAAVNATQQAIDSLGLEQDTANRNIDSSLTNVMGGYDQEATRNEGDYNDNTVTNNTNFSKNEQNALLSASQGARGLRGTLASIGALGGDGLRLANKAVTTGANADIGGAADTATTNQTNLDKAITNFRDEDKQRRADAQTAAQNQKVAEEGAIASKKQSFYQKMADLFSSGGDNANASKYLGMAGGLNNEIASKTAVAAAPIVAKTAAFTPGQMADYLAGNTDMTVQVAGDGTPGADPNTILAARKKDDKNANAPLVPATA